MCHVFINTSENIKQESKTSNVKAVAISDTIKKEHL